MFKRISLVLLLLLLVGVQFTRAQDETLTVIVHDSFNVSDDVLAAFEEETGITVEILFAGDAGTLVNQAVLSRENPQGDVLYGIDNTFLGRVLENDVFESYESPLLAEIPQEFILDTEYRVTPIDFGDVCLNYDKAYFAENNLPLPASLADLTDSVYKGLLVVQNPALSSPGLAFLLATVAQFGTEGDYTYLDYWADLVANEVKVVPDWTTAYFSDFTIAGGNYPLVVSYASSPPVEVIYADPPVAEAPTASLTGDGMCFRQIEFVGILKGTEHRAAAEQWIDFMLSDAFQADMPLQMFVFPVNPKTELPPEFVAYATLAENPATLPLAKIDANRNTWIEAWTETVLR